MDYLDVEREGTYIDATVGLGGHAEEILKRNPRASLIGLDIDEASLMKARERLRSFASRVILYHADFRLLPELEIDFSKVRGVLFDLGVSSYQLDTPERGFSFNHDGPLDMRMDRRRKTTAAKIINAYSEKALADIFRRHGELRQARRLAKAIVSLRKNKKIERTVELRRIVEEVCGWRPQKGKVHPAAKVFQALRIEVNQELDGLASFLETLAEKITRGARVVAIAFHSLEDRIVKKTFARLSSTAEPGPLLRLLTRKPVTPSDEEIAANPRARSAKMRAAERI
ncbi:MAG: 16S rRNA (cytosine(1402)-N(4))-methyltransferase RsmH [Candidatus Aminicenantales bacterium]